jgi:hypothetical protein
MCTHSRQMNVMGEHTVMHRTKKICYKTSSKRSSREKKFHPGMGFSSSTANYTQV